MAWEGSTRRETLPPNWREIREAVFARDGYRCVEIMPDGRRCINPAQECDHGDDRLDHSMGNLRSLCKPHHAARSASQGGRASQAARKKRRRLRPAERHWRPDNSHLPGGDADS